MHWNFNTQQMLPGRFLLESAIMAAEPSGCIFRGTSTPYRIRISVPCPCATRLPSISQRDISIRSRAAARTSLNGATIGRSSLLVPFPNWQHNGQKPQGHWFHALQVRLERRFSHGFTTQVVQLSKLMEAVAYLNAADPAPYRTIASVDRPQKLTFSAIQELPFGRGNLCGSASQLTDRVIGGWQVGLSGRSSAAPWPTSATCWL
jgi:hypothetical protein